MKKIEIINMSDTEKMAVSIENNVNAFFRAYKDGKIDNDQFTDGYLALARAEKMINKMIKDFEKGVKAVLEVEDEVTINNRRFYFVETQAKTFDATKAKATLESLDYSLEDFTTLSTRKTLKSDYATK